MTLDGTRIPKWPIHFIFLPLSIWYIMKRCYSSWQDGMLEREENYNYRSIGYMREWNISQSEGGTGWRSKDGRRRVLETAINRLSSHSAGWPSNLTRALNFSLHLRKRDLFTFFFSSSKISSKMIEFLKFNLSPTNSFRVLFFLPNSNNLFFLNIDRCVDALRKIFISRITD